MEIAYDIPNFYVNWHFGFLVILLVNIKLSEFSLAQILFLIRY